MDFEVFGGISYVLSPVVRGKKNKLKPPRGMWTNIVGARPPPPTRSQGRLTPSHKKCLFEPLKGFNKLSDPEGFIMVFPSC